MSSAVEPGSVHVGYEVAQRLKLEKGNMLDLAGESFRVARCMPEVGSIDDIRVIGSLVDVQRILKLDKQINEIKAIDCLCLTADQDPLGILRGELERALPEAKVVLLSAMADARAKQRQMIERYAAFSIALLLIISAAWIGLMAVMNVRERTSEIGLLRALGLGSSSIWLLFIGRAVLIGIAGAFIGYGLGCWLALSAGPHIFQMTAKAIHADPQLLGWALLAAPAFAAVASFIPATLAVTQDPAATLCGE